MEKIKALIALGLITEADIFEYHCEMERLEIEKTAGTVSDDEWNEMAEYYEQ